MNFCFVILIVALSAAAYGADLEKYQERSSWFPKSDTNMDLQWVLEVPSFYEPYLSRLQLARTAHRVLNSTEFENLNETEAIKTYCNHFQLKRSDDFTGIVINAFGKEPSAFPMNFEKVFPGRWDTLYVKSNEEFGVLGTTYIILADKKEGLLAVSQWMDGTMSFALAAPKGIRPSPDFLLESKKLLLELGFNPEYSAEPDYSECDATTGDTHSKNLKNGY